jgi:transposase InsO family protein
LESDNGTQFASAEFREYCKKINVTQVTSSPEYAPSNGLVERHIQTVKNVLLKMFSDGKSLWEALAAIRSTPVSRSLPAPSVLLQGRNLWGSLPFVSSSLKSTLVPASVVREELVRRRHHRWRKVNKLLLRPLCRRHAFLWLLRALLHVLVRACRLSVLLEI